MLKECAHEHVATVLFLDALDECRVNIKRAETVLEDVLLDVSPTDLQVVVACRTPAWPASLEDMLRGHWRGERDVCVYEIAPHSREQVRRRLDEQQIDDTDFFSALDGAGAHSLSLQPLGLQFLMSQFKEEATFSTSRWDLYEKGCIALLRESRRRLDDRNLTLPTPQQRLRLAGLLAASALLTNKTDFELDGTGSDESATARLDVEQLVNLPLVDFGIEWQIDREQCLEVLQSGIFITKGDGLFTFAHRTYAEFLAAHFISSLSLPTDKSADLLYLPDGSGRLIPQLRELAAWMGHGNPRLLAVLLRVDPTFVFSSSASLVDEADVAATFDELTRLVARQKFPIYERTLIRSYDKLAHSSLCSKVRSIVSDRNQASAVRQFVADVASATGLVGEIPELISIALDKSDNYEVRQSAANAIRDAGSSEQGHALYPLIDGVHLEDTEDELKGITLHCALDTGAPIGSLIAHIDEEKRSNYSGAYAHALRRIENTELAQSDIAAMVQWLASQVCKERLNHSWEDFVFHMFSKTALAVVQFDCGWSGFGKAAWLALSQHHRLSASREHRGFDVALELDSHSERRLQIFESMLQVAEGEPSFVAVTLRFGTGLLTDADGAHLIRIYESPSCTEAGKRVIANIMLGYVFETDGTVREWLLNTAGPNAALVDPLLEEVAHDYVSPIALDSQRADSLRKTLAQMQQRDEKQPEPAEKVRSVDLLLAALERGEAGDTWEWMNILSYLRYNDNFGGYQWPAKEVTTLPLWATLDITIRLRLAGVAFGYLRDTGPVTTDLAPNQGNAYEDGGIAALVFLHSVGQGSTTDFPSLVVKWARGLARYHLDGQPRKVINELLHVALGKEPDSVTHELLSVCKQYLTSDFPRMPAFAHEVATAALLSELEAVLPTLQDDRSFLVLCEYLTEHGSQAAIDTLVDKLANVDDLSSQIAAKYLVLLAKRAPKRFVDAAWSRISSDARVIAELAAEFQVIGSSQTVPLLLVDASVTESIFEILEKHYPTSADDSLSGYVTRRHHVQAFRGCCLYALRERADTASIAALERIATRHSDISWIATLVHDAEQKAARDAWTPFDLHETFAALGLASGRVVRTDAELHAVVIDELGSIAKKFVRSRHNQPFTSCGTNPQNVQSMSHGSAIG
ncbi:MULTISPECIES: hypothetical protein [Burkholderia]|uniref:hypothetical protein n=1 Tax=Burkholderia TaxID=32008 RepID=UPI00254AE50B|nr:hypothetical protein [Burkholderia sp. lyk4-R2A-23]